MNYDGEKFLLKLYNDMYNDESVKHSSTKSDNKYEAVRKYIERLERVHEKAINHKTDTGMNLLKNYYYDKYVIKREDISEKYIDYLDKVQFDQYGVHMSNSQREEQKDLIIQDQKKSLDEWIDYFTSEDSKFYPTWTKYWAFQGMLTIGNYDTNKGIYNKRSKTTVAPFPELDREVLSKSIDLIIKEVNKEEIEDKDLEQLVKNGNFFKLYTVQLKDKRESNFGEETKGEWIKYEQGDNYQKLHQSLQGKNTGWCTAGEETCRKQVKNGDFYVYYTYDKEGKATNPRLAIRMDGKNRIGEIRGVAKDQNIEPHFEDILSKKLKGFPDAESYQKRVKDIQMLTYVYTKYENDKPLTKDDIKFIYEIDNEVKTMGWDIDPRLDEMRENKKGRKIKDVLSKDEIIDLVKKDYLVLSFIPEEMLDKEVVLELVIKEGAALRFVPKNLMDEYICWIAVFQFPDALQFVPEEIIDGYICRTAVKQDEMALKYVPENIIDKEICLETVKRDGMALKYVPENIIDKEICLEAVKQTVTALQYVPENIMDKEMCWAAVKQHCEVLKYVSENIMDKEMCLEAVKQDVLLLSSVPSEMIDKEICIEAVKQREYALYYVPEELREEVEQELEKMKNDDDTVQVLEDSDSKIR